jgi:amino acid adenylation domain-containing protein
VKRDARAAVGSSLARAGLSLQEKRDLLRQLIAEELLQPKYAPVSFPQERLLFLDEMEPGSTFYCETIATRIHGVLNLARLRKVIAEIVRRHEILRTTFSAEDGRPTQRISPRMLLQVPIVDLGNLSEWEREQEVGQVAREQSGQPFVLSRGPLLRVAFVELGRADHVVVVTMHHIISDGWSLGVILREMIDIYLFWSGLKPSPLPELPIQYSDFARWQRQLSEEELEKRLAYWRGQLSNLPALNLPTDRPRPTIQGRRGETYAFEIPPELYEALKAVSRSERCTLFMILLATVQFLLSRYSGQEDVVVGSPVAGRNRPELELLIGLFVNMLVLRTDFSGDPGFRTLLGRVRKVCLEAFAHQEAPFEKVVEALQPDRDLSREPLFQVSIDVERDQIDLPRIPGVRFAPLEFDNGTAKYDLALFFWEGKGKLTGAVQYNLELFDRSTISRMLGHLGTLWGGMVRDPDRPISCLPLLTPGERQQLSVEWPTTDGRFESSRSLPERFELAAERMPDRVAVSAEGGSLSYRELDLRSNQLARHLRSLGIAGEHRVGLSVERSPEMLVGILGILKAGAAYVPLDPQYPKERIAFMLEDSGAAVVVTQRHLVETLPPRVEKVRLDADWEVIGSRSKGALSGPLVDSLAYVIYTSGSTGQPKGVLVSHRNVVRLFEATRDRFRFAAEDVWTLFHSYAFDFSVWEMWGALLHGGRLLVVPYWVSRSPDRFHELLHREGVTVLNQTPSAFFPLMRVEDSEEVSTLPTLRLVIFGGEALPISSLETWFERHGDQRPQAVNMYGITETTVHVTYRRLWAGDAATAGGSVIGTPIPDLATYVLDERRQPVPAGVAGELYVGGEGLARGYLDRPGLTAERLVPHPSSDIPGARLYRTGDLARWRGSGELEYLGRIDHQVKIRGFRIELGEIESVLRLHRRVNEAVVVVRDSSSGDRQLAAYVVTAPADGAASADAEPAEFDELTTHWQSLYDETYRSGPGEFDPAFNIKGWNSSYTGRPIPAEEMREWRDAHVASILGRKPSRVLEIGCGTGLLLFPIAPHCESYMGTDFSATALESIRNELTKRPIAGVTLSQRMADDFTGIETGSFDAVILNSVIQYFPGAEYLLRVLERAVSVVRPGGFVFVGDVRNLRLLEPFHAAVQLSQAVDSITRGELRGRVRRQLSQEKELLVDPALFRALAQEWPGLRHAEIQLERGRHWNELTQFRYDVVLHVGGCLTTPASCQTLGWEEDRLTLAEVRQRLAEARPEMLGIRGVPNVRVRKAVMTTAWLAEPEESTPVGDLRRLKDRETERAGVDPEALWSLAGELSYLAEIGWSESAEDGRFDVLFRRPQSGGAIPILPQEAIPVRPWHSYTNAPTRQLESQQLELNLREHVREMLPEYMVPSFFTVLDALPLTSTGKVDRKALPSLEARRPELKSSYLAPRTALEKELVRIWSQVLGVDRVGVQDNFFEMGGHSLLATQLLSRVRKELQREIPLRKLFESPTVAGLASAIDGGVEPRPAPPIVPVPRDRSLALSFAQQRLWFLDQLLPGNPFFNIPIAVQLTGPLDVPSLKRGIDEILVRHESLRTTFGTVHGAPIQEIAPVLRLTVPFADLSSLSDSGRESEIRRLSQEEALRSFDLSRGPLIRAKLVRTGVVDHVFLLTMHHVVSDGWSIGVFVRELVAIYRAFSRGAPSPLAALPIQYPDYAAWQRQRMQGETLLEHLSYWKKQLAELPVLELPADRPRPAVSTFRGARRRFELGEDLSRSLSELSTREQATPFMTSFAAFQLMLARICGQEDVVVGSGIANRNRAEIEPLIGFFINMLVLRTRLAGNPSFRELLARTREVCLGAYAHQDLPFEKLVDELHPKRDLSREPLFQVVFAFQNYPVPTLRLPEGLALRPLELERATSAYDLTVQLWEEQERLTGFIEYNTQLFDSTTIARMVEHYRTLVEAVVLDPDLPIQSLSLMKEGERQQVLYEWNDSEAENLPVEILAHQAFERQVQNAPDAVAVVFRGEALSYQELNARSNRLARRLRSRNARREAVVALCVDPSLDMLVGILGILKAGAAYLPLDSGYPMDRLAFTIENSDACGLVTQERWLQRLPQRPEAFCLDRDWSQVEPYSAENLVSDVTPGNLAYLIYTSGSTGRPKGVGVTHAGLMNLVRWHQKTYEVSPADRASQLASLGFDASVWESWPYLAAGASIHIPDDETRRSPSEVARWICEEGVTLSFLPTPLAAMAFDVDWPNTVPLRALLTGGDRLPRAPRQDLPFAVTNHYGPTENSVVSTWCQVSGRSQAAPPIGRPISNTRAYVVDRFLNPLPTGIPGELHVAGAGLARGYLGNPELTAERFLPDPFAEEAGARLYKTGDLVRQLSDGGIDFLRRLDHQVKVRGYRIELGEIESTLREHPQVREAAVEVRETRAGENRLVAYVVPGPGTQSMESALRDYLRAKLPSYMVPGSFVELQALPLSPSGKLDRRALPAPSDERPGLESRYVKPRSPVEEKLARVWSELLGVEPIGVYDDFFELGGHSLLATQLVSRVREAFGVELALRDLFRAATVAGLAEVIDQTPSRARAHPIQRIQRGAERPLSFAQQRLWFLDQLVPGNSFYNLPAAVRLEGPLDIPVLKRALSEIVRRHEALRTTFPMVEGRPVQRVVPAARLPVSVVELSGLSDEEREAEAERLSVAEAQRPFRLATGPLVRAVLLRFGPGEHLALLTMHHIASDGWSMGVFVREAGELYEAFAQGRPSPLPELPVQYGDFASWQREWLHGEVLEKQLSYWKQQLADVPVLRLPADRPRPAEQSFRGTIYPVELPEDLLHSVKELSSREGVTLFMTLLAGFQALLSRYSSQKQIVVGSGIANRNQTETEGLIGFFVNMLVLRTDLSGEPSFREILGRVREVCLGAYAHQDLPFEKLVDELQPDRDLGREPIFQVIFELQNFPLPSLTAGGLTLTPLRVDWKTAKYDLSFYLWEHSDQLSGFVEYSTDLFDHSTIGRMVGHYRKILEAIVENPDQKLSEPTLLEADEELLLAADWGKGRASRSAAGGFPVPNAVIEELYDDIEEGVL